MSEKGTTAVTRRSDGSGNQEVALSVTAEQVANRAMSEVQAMMIIAKKYPRNEAQALERMLMTCDMKSFAESSSYEYPRGGTKVTGLSIRAAEMLAQKWGNVEFGVVELEQRHRESTVMAYAWDLETNTRQSKVFQVPHIRYSKEDGNKVLTDPRDIYEMIANNGARRMRACILGVIPAHIQEEVEKACEATMGRSDIPIETRRANMLASFKLLGVTREEIEALIGSKVEAFSNNDLVRLRKINQSLDDNMSKKADWFKPASSEDTIPNEGGSKSEKLAGKLKKGSTTSPAPKEEPEDKIPMGDAAPAVFDRKACNEEIVKICTNPKTPKGAIRRSKEGLGMGPEDEIIELSDEQAQTLLKLLKAI